MKILRWWPAGKYLGSACVVLQLEDKKMGVLLRDNDTVLFSVPDRWSPESGARPPCYTEYVIGMTDRVLDLNELLEKPDICMTLLVL